MRGTSNACFKCGRQGHWASNCTEKEGSKNLGQFAGEAVRDGEEEEEDGEEMDPAYLAQLAEESPFPTVEAAAMMATGIKRAPRKQLNSEKEPNQPYYPPPPSLPLSGTNPPPSMEALFSSLPSGRHHCRGPFNPCTLIICRHHCRGPFNPCTLMFC